MADHPGHQLRALTERHHEWLQSAAFKASRPTFDGADGARIIANVRPPISIDSRRAMPTNEGSDDVLFRDAVQGLVNGDFSRLEPLFTGDAARRPQVVQWHEEGRFRDEPRALAEALTCACFLGRTDVAEHLLKHDVDPSGGAGTGLNAFHWAANRGQVNAVRLLLRWNAPLGARSMYGGNILDTAVWSAINEPRSGQREVIEELLAAGARLEDEEYPTGDREIDAMLQRHQAV